MVHASSFATIVDETPGDYKEALRAYLEPTYSTLSSAAWIGYSFRLDSGKPNLISPGRKLFNYSDEDVEVIYLPSSVSKSFVGNTMSETAAKISFDASLDGSYGAFSAAVSSCGQRSTSTSHKQHKAVRQTRSIVYSVKALPAYVADKVRSDVREFLLTESAETIVNMYGEFYTMTIDLGGVISTIFEQTATQFDKSSDFEATVKAEYKALTASVAASGSVGTASSKSGSSESIDVTVKVEGGRTDMWLSAGSFDDMQNMWAGSFNDENMSPVDVRLKPIWEMIKDIDTGKGQEVENYLKKKWEADKTNLELLDGLAQRTITCEKGCFRCGYNWYSENAGTTNFKNGQCGCCQGTPAQVKDCGVICKQSCAVTNTCTPCKYGCNTCAGQFDRMPSPGNYWDWLRPRYAVWADGNCQCHPGTQAEQFHCQEPGVCTDRWTHYTSKDYHYDVAHKRCCSTSSLGMNSTVLV